MGFPRRRRPRLLGGPEGSLEETLPPDSETPSGAATAPPRALLANANYRLLWFAGGVGNSMRWLEMLAVAIFTFELTGSAFMVAVATVARTLPQLVVGAFAGVIGETLNRKVLLSSALFVAAASAGSMCLLAATGAIQLWHIIVAAAVTGAVNSGEMAVRRRMIGEVVPAARIGRAVAFDSLTGSFSRMIGPVLGGIVFGAVGLVGAYLISMLMHLVAAVGISRLDIAQERRRLDLMRIGTDLAEGLAIARARPVLLAVLLVSIITNMFGFSYAVLVTPIAIERFAASAALVGVLAAAEPLGAVLGGIALSTGWLPADHPKKFIGGAIIFLSAIIAMALTPWFVLALAVLIAGGVGTARYAIMQTSLVLSDAPPALRSRVMGLVTVCIGTAPLGTLSVGALSEAFGPTVALITMSGIGLALLALVRWRIAELRGR
jgi:MFS family permease